jgi:hypothetical protein
MQYIESLKNRYNAVDRTFYDAIKFDKGKHYEAHQN